MDNFQRSLAWKCYRGALPVRDKLYRHSSRNTGPRCGQSDETAVVLLNKIRNTGTKDFSDNEEESFCLPVTLKAEISPHLPPPPEGLTRKQIKRRCVLECIISSEKSYIESLQRIHNDYETPILEAVDSQKSKVKSSLKKLREILNYHRMFQIELANRVNDWQEENIIGDIFIASFSKSMVLDAYSVYVNNFTATMEDIKKLQRTRQSFRDFLKQKETSSLDRLSIFALMVKPIQRFPQFIMCLQDLLKYTPKGHEDRKALQLAVTILENLALKLNDRKRESEKKFAAKQLSVKIRMSAFHNSFLIREDDMFHIVNNCTKKRRLIMLNDALVCIKVQESERDGELIERYKHKWTVPLQDVRLKSSCSMLPKMKSPYTLTEPYGFQRIDSKSKNVEDIYEEIYAMNHDYSIWSQMHNLASSLKLTYEVLNEELINGILSDLQHRIQVQTEQVQLVNNCIIELEIPDKSGKVCEVFQTWTPTMKQHWCLDLAIAKLALSPQNQPGWDVPVLNTDQLTESLSAFHVSSLAIDVSTHMSQLQCAVGVYLQSFTGYNIKIPHIWVCSNIAESGGQVSIISVQTGCSSVYLNEAFQATDSAITCVESVVGNSSLDGWTTSMDTVWMATETCKMYIYGLQSCKSRQRQPIKVFDLPGKVLHLLYVGDKIFAGMDNGSVLIFERKADGDYSWCVEHPEVISLSSSPIVCLLDITCDNCILAASDNMIYKIDYFTGKIQVSCCLSPEGVIQHIVQAGVGIWVSYQNSPTIHLYHIENLNLLQEINIASAGTRVLPADSPKECTVTCLLSSLGMLWIGTNLGLLVSFPLPRLRNGVPLVSGRPFVSYHGHKETVRFLLPFMLGYRTKSGSNTLQYNSKTLSMASKIQTLKTTGVSSRFEDLIEDDNGVKIENDDDEDDDDDNQTLVEEGYKMLQEELKEKLSKRYNSTPNLLIEEDEDKNEVPNVQNKEQRGTKEMEVLYRSLMGNSIRRSRTQSLHHHRLSKLRGRADSGGQHGNFDSKFGSYNDSSISNRNTLAAIKGSPLSSLSQKVVKNSAIHRRSKDETMCQNVSAGHECTVPGASTTSDSTLTTTTTTTTTATATIPTSTLVPTTTTTTTTMVEKKKATLVRQRPTEEMSEEPVPEANVDDSETASTTNTQTTITTTPTSSTTTPTSSSSSSASSSSSPSSSSSTTATTTTTTTTTATARRRRTTTATASITISTATNHFSSLQSQMSQSSRIWEFQEESDCNSIMIVSGGNGYFNASPNAAANKTSRGNDSTLLFWIYKI
eukprot:XP_014776104.1 PREDICTED: rho guanine nucleotide exchange factor 10-like [Octopus bimaculoides]